MGTYQARFDAKGRMSVPAPFRAILRTGSADGTAALVLRPSDRHRCIEGWPAATFDALTARFEHLDLFSQDDDDLRTALYAAAWPVEADKEGRISVPEFLVQHAGLTETAVFMGKGRSFEIWEPAGAGRRMAEASQGIVARQVTLPAARA